MIRGMTGKSSIRFSTAKYDAELEIRSVNSRYFEFKMKTPPRFSALEIEIRKIVSQKLGRGKIDLGIRVNEKEDLPTGSLINKSLVKAYLEESYQLAEELGISNKISLKEVLSLPQVLRTEIGELEEETTIIFLEKINELIDKMLPMMIAEGESTIIDVQKSLMIMEKSVNFIQQRYPDVLDKYKNSLKERVMEVTSLKPSDERLSIELEIFASRTAVNEELVRLEHHIRVMNDILSGKRKESSKELDFIGQEMNREVNTIASKSLDFDITEQTIILKSEIEKMREQFRNIV